MRFIVLAAALLLFTSYPLAAAEKAPESGTSAEAGKSSRPTMKGPVLETMNSGGYTYVSLDLEGIIQWIAIPESAVAKGDLLEILPGVEMGEHYSKSLKRTFPSIIFSPGLAGEKPKEDPEVTKKKKSAHASVGVDPAKEGGGEALLANIKVEKAAGENAYTVEEIVSKRVELDNKRVTVRGKVVKASKGIMGTNWYHLRDGSGSADMKTNNLVVTGRNELLLGDTVTATGVIHKEKDFGGGYYYDVIMEESSFNQ